MKRKQVIVMSVLMTIHPNDKTNTHFQTLIDEWQKVYDNNENFCQDYQRNLFKRNNFKVFNRGEDWKNVGNATQKMKERALVDTTPYGTGGWDPFHRSLERVSAIIRSVHTSSTLSHHLFLI